MVIVLLDLPLEQLLCFEVHLQFHGYLLVKSKLVSHDGLTLRFSDVNEHVGICKVFAESLDQLARRFFEHGLSDEFKRAEVSADSLSEGIVSFDPVDFAIIELVPGILESWFDEGVVVTCVCSSSMNQDGVQVIFVYYFGISDFALSFWRIRK